MRRGQIVSEGQRDQFLSAIDDWICDCSYLDIRYLARIADGGIHITVASVYAGVFPLAVKNEFELVTEDIVIGHVQDFCADKRKINEVINEAIKGRLLAGERELEVLGSGEINYYSESLSRDAWFWQKTLTVSGNRAFGLTYEDGLKIDNQLRVSSPPFDGLNDAVQWLGLGEHGVERRASTIQIYVAPPIDINISASYLKEGELNVVLVAHKGLDKDKVCVAIRSVPTPSLDCRALVSHRIDWNAEKDGICKGDLNVNVGDAEAVIVILSVGGSVIRRHWFRDNRKSKNNRYLIVSTFDRDLSQIRRNVEKPQNPDKFEIAIASLLFMYGFNPCVQVETESPDILVMTPRGRVVIIECTMKISDFYTKLGKLVQRRGLLSQTMMDRGHDFSPAAVLICAQPKDSIAVSDDQLRSHNVILLAQEDISAALERVVGDSDPDQLIDEAEIALQKGQGELPFGV